jgi:ABC-2 type transport system ATP-binding protein
MSNENAIEVQQISKNFGNVVALENIDLKVRRGSVMGMLGPNGAGKTTLVRILTTLLRPTSGTATVLGYDVVRHARHLRSFIGLAGQSAAVDDLLTGRENIHMAARLYHMPKRQAQQRTQQLLEQFDLVDAADRSVKGYSGGMRRRLDLAASLVANPPMIFLDEPTTGLDPRSRLELWDVIRNLVSEGTTVLLTTQYLEEADRLADQITVIDQGKLIAQGTAQQLKHQAGSEFIEITVRDREHTKRAADIITRFAENNERDIDHENNKVAITVKDGPATMVQVVRALDSQNIALANMAVRQPTLDDVFLALTGRTAEEAATESEQDAN